MGKWELRKKLRRRKYKSRDKRRWKDNLNMNLWGRKDGPETFLSGLCYLYIAFVRHKDLVLLLIITCLYVRTHGVQVQVQVQVNLWMKYHFVLFILKQPVSFQLRDTYQFLGKISKWVCDKLSVGVCRVIVSSVVVSL